MGLLARAAYNMDVTYWAPVGDGSYGSSSGFGAPTILKCRWEDRQDQALSQSGEEFTTAAVVYVPVPVEIGGFLSLGDKLAATDPTMLSDAHEIKGLTSIPSIRNVITERKALLG